MNRHRLTGCLTIAVLGLCSCGIMSDQPDAGEIVNEFYASQTTRKIRLDSDIFLDEKTENTTLLALTERDEAFGGYLEHKRIGSNRQVMFSGQTRKTTATYVFEVEHRRGRTRETITLIRSNAGDPFRISGYTFEKVTGVFDPSPAGTSSI